MKVLLVYHISSHTPHADRNTVRDLFKKICKQLSIDHNVICITGEWNTLDLQSYLQLITPLLDSTHVVAAADESESSSLWLTFLAAFTLGRRIPFYIHRFSTDLGSYSFLAHAVTGENPGSLVRFLSKGMRRFYRRNMRQTARRNIINRGYAVTEDALSQCIAEGDIESVLDYLHAGFSPNSTNRQGVPLLCTAVRSEHLRIITTLLDQGADVNIIARDRGNSPLMDAAAEGKYEITSLLLKSGAQTDFQSKNGQTALVLAIGRGFTDIAILLIRAGADVHIADSLGMTALKYAKLFSQNEVVELISEIPPREQLLD